MRFIALFLISAATPVQEDEVRLFNGKDLSGWSAVLDKPDVKMEDVWSVKDGILICQGKPRGYIRTDGTYENYVLSLKWRWPEGTKGGNSGVLLHTTDPGARNIWPRSIEAQLAKGNAGDFWIIGTDLDVENEASRKKGRRHLNLTDGSEKPVGQWNEMEITCKGSEVVVKVNGDLVNHATNCTQSKGAISLQSEGALIHFKDVVLRPLK